MDRAIERVETFFQAASRFEEGIRMALSYAGTDLYPFLRDSAIQRFEFTFEAFWKAIKESLYVLDGVKCHSPKSCIRALYETGYVGRDTTAVLLKMVDSRNLTSHVYYESIAEKIFSKLPKYLEVMRESMSAVKQTLKDCFYRGRF